MERGPNRLDKVSIILGMAVKKIPTWLRIPANFIMISVNCAKQLKQF